MKAVTRTKPEDHPLSRLRWLDPATLKANAYNPNRVFGPELDLLRESVRSEGWTQPIVITPDNEIVDGFHRWRISQEADIAALTGGLVPAVTLDGAELVQRMMATVRHNRARGQHGILKMGNIVRMAQDAGASREEIRRGFGMEDEEVDRLADVRPSPVSAGKESYGRGWVPDEKVRSRGDKLSAKAAAKPQKQKTQPRKAAQAPSSS